MRRLFTRLIVTLSTLTLAQMATAADMAVKVPPPPPPAFSWTGWYVGLNAGYNWGRSSVTSTAVPTGGLVPGVATGLAIFGTYNLDPSRNGFIGGAQAGYNWQLNNWVTGIEADIQDLGQHKGKANQLFTGPVPGVPSEQYVGTQFGQAEVSWLGTLRGRLGSLINPSLLIYATGGLAYGGVKAGGAIAAQENDTIGGTLVYFPSVGGAINSQTRAGWTLGGGWEWMIAPHWSVEAEYLYYDLGTVSTNYAVNTLCTPAFCAFPTMPIYGSAAVHVSTTRLDGNIARAGVNYHF